MSRPLLKLAGAVMLLVLFTSFGAQTVGAHTAKNQAAAAKLPVSYLKLHSAGTSKVGSPAPGTGNGNTSLELSPQREFGDTAGQSTPTGPLPTSAPVPTPQQVTTNNPSFTGFNGLSHANSRLASGGNQFSLEPPDQGLCAGGGYVIEAVNDVLAIYTTDTHQIVSGPTALNAFFNLAPSIIRATHTFGPFISDPKCYYDAQTGFWFLTVLEIDTNPQTGADLPHAATLLAVSQSEDPTGGWGLFSIDATNDGTNGTPNHPGCPCLGDQPLIGADQNGFYITTNEFPLFQNGFNGAQVYALSKLGLINAAAYAEPLPTVVTIDASSALVPYGGLSYSIQPATTPAYEGLDDAEPNKGTEYFLSALEFTGTYDNRIAAWALTNTRSLDQDQPDVQLSYTVISSETYGQPPNVTQKPGPTPLGSLIGAPLNQLNSNDDRMNQVVYSHGLLWSGVNTVVQQADTSYHVGIAYFLVKPSWKNGELNASVKHQGYVSVAGSDVLFPSIGVVPADGVAYPYVAVISYTLAGAGYYPSAAYSQLSLNGTVDAVHIAGAGYAPADGFTGYAAFGGSGVERWGDYSAAVTDENGVIWIASEYIPNAPRTSLANWGTFISSVTLNN